MLNPVKDNDQNSVVFRQSPPTKPENRRAISNSLLSPKLQSKVIKNSLCNHSDSDGEIEPMPIKPWSPVPSEPPTQSTLKHVNDETSNNDESPASPSPQLTIAFRAIFEMITEDLDKFVYTPAPNGLGDVQCRITRDKRGVEKGLFPTYYMHVERPGDGRKVRLTCFK